jgi:hypothetical protein
MANCRKASRTSDSFIVILLAPVDPLAQLDAWDPALMLFIGRDFGLSKPDIQVSFDTTIDIYLNDQVVKEHGLPPGTRPLKTGSHVFTAKDNVKRVFVGRCLGVTFI